MNSYLIISSQKIQREEYAKNMCDQMHISQFDRTIINPEKSIGIEDIRIMQKKLFFKPLKGENKAVILHDAQTATTETQNALLKSLEEPPPHTYILLTAAYTDTFLPTILSRCTLIVLTNTAESLPTETIQALKVEWHILFSAPLGTKLKMAQDIAKDKAEALQWLKNSLRVNRLILLEKINTNQSYMHIVFLVQQLQKAYIIAKTTNVNLRFLLEEILLPLSLPDA